MKLMLFQIKLLQQIVYECYFKNSTISVVIKTLWGGSALIQKAARRSCSRRSMTSTWRHERYHRLLSGEPPHQRQHHDRCTHTRLTAKKVSHWCWGDPRRCQLAVPCLKLHFSMSVRPWQLCHSGHTPSQRQEILMILIRHPFRYECVAQHHYFKHIQANAFYQYFLQ